MSDLLNREIIAARIKEAYETATEKGWHDEPREFGTVIALIHSEITEAYDIATTNVNYTAIAEELADVLIRIYDSCGEFGIPLAESPYLDGPHYYVVLDVDLATHIARLHRFTSYALESYRKDGEVTLWSGIAVSFAEICFRINAISEAYKLNVNQAVIDKMAKNKTRPHRHGGKRI